MRRVLAMLALIVAVSACAAGQGKEKTNSTSKDKKATVAEGEAVSELGKSVVYVFQAKNNTYWFGSNDRGVYRYDGKTIVNYTTKDGLVSNCIRGIQEDAGNLDLAISLGRWNTH